MVMEFKKGRAVYFVVLFIFALIAVKLFIPLNIGGVDFSRIWPYVPIENKFFQVILVILMLVVGQNIGSMAASAIGNKEYARLTSILMLRCESTQVIEQFEPAFATRSMNLATALAKGMLMTQAYFAAGQYDKAIAAAEKTLEFSMNRADIPAYLSCCSICEYLILACCESGDTGKAAQKFKTMEEAVSHTASDKEINKTARRIMAYTRNYITFTVNKKYDSVLVAQEELNYARNNYERIMTRFLLGRLYLRSGDHDAAQEAFTYVDTRHSDFLCRQIAHAELEKLTPPAQAEPAAE